MVSEKNQTKKAEDVTISKPKWNKNGTLSVTVGANGNQHRVNISAKKLKSLEKENPALYAQVAPIFDSKANGNKTSKKVSKKPKQPKENKAEVREEVQKLYDDYIEALKKQGEVEIKHVADFEKVYLNGKLFSDVRHNNVFSVVSKYNPDGRRARPTENIMQFVDSQLEAQKNMPASSSRSRGIKCPFDTRVLDKQDDGSYTCPKCLKVWQITEVTLEDN